MSNEDKVKARDYNQKAIHYNKLVHGEHSLQVSNGQFISANLALKTGDYQEALNYMNDALTIFDVEHEQLASELTKSKTEMLLIQVRYYSAFANIFYVMGSYP